MDSPALESNALRPYWANFRVYEFSLAWLVVADVAVSGDDGRLGGYGNQVLDAGL